MKVISFYFTVVITYIDKSLLVKEINIIASISVFYGLLQQSKVPQADWLRLGLYQPRPRYTDRIYFSTKCMPSKGESKLFHSMMRRPAIKVRDAVAKIAQAKESFYRSDKNLEEYIRVRNWWFCNTVLYCNIFKGCGILIRGISIKTKQLHLIDNISTLLYYRTNLPRETTNLWILIWPLYVSTILNRE